jgi:hypothetical protein
MIFSPGSEPGEQLRASRTLLSCNAVSEPCRFSALNWFKQRIVLAFRSHIAIRAMAAIP